MANRINTKKPSKYIRVELLKGKYKKKQKNREKRHITCREKTMTQIIANYS